jgi:hypothetical protein
LLLALYVLLTWLTIIVFYLTPKYLSFAENIIVFSGVSIVIFTFFLVVYLNEYLIGYAKEPEMFICLCLYRNAILPVGLLIFTNCFLFMPKRLVKLALSLGILAVLLLVEYLTVWTGVRTFTGWNGYLTVIYLLVLMLFSGCLGKAMKKLGDGA